LRLGILAAGVEIGPVALSDLLSRVILHHLLELLGRGTHDRLVIKRVGARVDLKVHELDLLHLKVEVCNPVI
jgi:hypothetical protein